MAGFTDRGGIDVCGTLADGVSTIVTRGASFTGERVIKHWHQPVDGGVAGVTGQCCRNVIHTFAGGDNTIMAAFAVTDDLSMVHGDQR